MIEVERLSKVYRVPVKEPGLRGSLRSLIHRRYTDVRAVDDISFSIEPGECVGFLGPNGAGKTTTLKMLSGLLVPTDGRIRAFGHEPTRREPELLRRITLVMGQKQQLIWDLPPRETFELNRALYGIPTSRFARTVADLVDLLGLGEVVDRPTRNLSLGERMKCELAAALIHEPDVLFLDEPTIGLDVSMQVVVRRFVQQWSRDRGATVLLTSHYMDDIAALCPRVLVIDHGGKRFDGGLTDLVRRMSVHRRIVVRTATSEEADAIDGQQATRTDALTLQIAVEPAQVNATVDRVLRAVPHAELTVEDPPIEDVIDRVFRDGAPVVP